MSDQIQLPTSNGTLSINGVEVETSATREGCLLNVTGFLMAIGRAKNKNRREALGIKDRGVELQKALFPSSKQLQCGVTILQATHAVESTRGLNGQLRAEILEKLRDLDAVVGESVVAEETHSADVSDIPTSGGIEILPISDLRPHPLSSEIYDEDDTDEADESLAESIRELGVVAPLLVDTKNQILSGSRRHRSARKAGLEVVPAIRATDAQAGEMTKTIIEANHSREKSNFQIGMEVLAIMRSETEKAKTRRIRKPLFEVETFPPQNPSPDAAGKTRDHVGRVIGVSGRTAQDAGKVVEAIMRLRAKGKDEEASQLKTLLNKSVHRARRNLDKGAPAPARPRRQSRLKLPFRFTTGGSLSSDDSQGFLKPADFGEVVPGLDALFTGEVSAVSADGTPLSKERLAAWTRGAKAALSAVNDVLGTAPQAPDIEAMVVVLEATTGVLRSKQSDSNLS